MSKFNDLVDGLVKAGIDLPKDALLKYFLVNAKYYDGVSVDDDLFNHISGIKFLTIDELRLKHGVSIQEEPCDDEFLYNLSYFDIAIVIKFNDTHYIVEYL